MNKLVLSTICWGFLLWLVGYILGIILFFFAPKNLIGFIILPIGVVLTTYILNIKFKYKLFKHYAFIAVIWLLIALIFDYFFIVVLFNSSNYYKSDVVIYYVITFILPFIFFFLRNKK